MVTLFKEGAHITDVVIQYNGEVAIGSGGAGGEYYMRIPAEERPNLLSALAGAAEDSLSQEMSDKEINESISALFLEHFGGSNQDPYVEIGKFLKTNNVPYKGDYWPDR